jgi:uroporphyrinogen-III decarboxylase
MTLRERIEAVFHGRTPDAMAWYADLTYWYGTHQKIGDLPERWRGERGIGKLHREYNVGEYVPGASAYQMEEGEQVRVETSETKETVSRIWHTPVGAITERRGFSAPSWSWGFTEHAVKNVEDLRVLRYIMEHRRYSPTPEKIAVVDKDYGDYGLPVLAVPGTPITELNKTWMGVMDMCYLLADEPAEVAKTLQSIAESQERIMQLTEENPCGYVMICENLSGETMGSYFDGYMRDYLSRLADRFHAYGKKVMIHIDGSLRGVLNKIADTGIDCVDAATPKPVGDVALDELRDMAGPNLLLLGGIPGAMFAPPFNAESMERHVKEIISLHKDSGKFMLGVADQVPPNGDIRLVKLISEIVEEYGRY